MVQVSAARSREYTSSVILEVTARSIDSYGNGLVRNCLLERKLPIGRNILLAAECGCGGERVRVACSLGALIGVVAFGGEASAVDDVCEGTIGSTAIATLVIAVGITVNNFLLGKRGQSTGFYFIYPFSRCHCRDEILN
ncbi:hypothetical protein Droror1_Dr00010622 [Drosera rotundifolia]